MLPIFMMFLLLTSSTAIFASAAHNELESFVNKNIQQVEEYASSGWSASEDSEDINVSKVNYTPHDKRPLLSDDERQMYYKMVNTIIHNVTPSDTPSKESFMHVTNEMGRLNICDKKQPASTSMPKDSMIEYNVYGAGL